MKDKDWLKDNIRSVLAIIWSIWGMVIYLVVLFKDVKSDDKTTFLIVNSVFGITTFILGYYFGASKPQTDNRNSATTFQATQTKPTSDDPKPDEPK